ncbi:hypothetical protein [Nocardia suismassiliense]|uniref:hypothetical protein n=1 Tax=Nocardia suismassiliense TaxID=2077092 RepID=UPI001F1973B2|nr:hypothetical protein [Nocardia suismassiliense]
MIIDTNLERADSGEICCRHCAAVLGPSPREPMTSALVNVSAARCAGPGIKSDPALFTDRAMVLRQLFCPGCLALLATEVVPEDEPSYRKWALK